MALYIEYYEVDSGCGYDEYYYMPIDREAKNKKNFDYQSTRIWKVNTRTLRFEEIKNTRKIKTPVTQVELFAIQLQAKPVPYSEDYLYLQEVKRHREQRETKKSDSTD